MEASFQYVGEELVATVKSGADRPTACPDGSLPARWYRDADRDGYGSGLARLSCTRPFGYVRLDGDCDDTDASVYPGATEALDDVDNNCDGTVDDGCAFTATLFHDEYTSEESDGYVPSPFWIFAWYEGYSDTWTSITWSVSDPPSESDSADTLSIMLLVSDLVDHPWLDTALAYDQVDANTWASWPQEGCEGYTAWADTPFVAVDLYHVVDMDGYGTGNCRAYFDSVPTGSDEGTWVPYTP